MKPLPTWNKRIEAVQEEPAACRNPYVLKKSPHYYAERITFVETIEQAQALLEFALQRPLSHIGFDTEFGYDRPGIIIDKRNTAYDPRSIRPLLLSLALAEPGQSDGGCLYSFVIDLRVNGLHHILNDLFRLSLPIVGHYAKAELFCLWQLGITAPLMLWDTFILEKLLNLGRHHHKYRLRSVAHEFERLQAKEESGENKRFGFSLVATCQRYGVAYRMETEKERLQQSFLNHPQQAPFSEEQIAYAAEDAIAAGRLYPLQVQQAVAHGLLRHCETVEMDWVLTNARIEWTGARVDQHKQKEAVTRISNHLERLEQRLATVYGILNSQSHKQLAEFFQACGLLHLFHQNGTLSFDKTILKKHADRHPAIALLRAARRASDLLSDKLLSPDFIGPDGRVRAEHRQLGTETGRQTSRWPNFLGLDRVLRPLVIPEEGYGLGEVDWSQVEVGVAAAIYGDEALVRMFNSGDVYSSMAQHFFRDELEVADLTLSGKEFKAKHKLLRNQMKSCTLGIIYGMTPAGLAQSLGVPKSRAAALQQRFMALFPRLHDALELAAQCGAIRGYAYSVSGLRRWRAETGKASRWEKNWLTNHPVQGSAAVVFKAAGNRLDRLYRGNGARIIIPLHDAFIFEAPLESLETVAELTARVMRDTLQEYFPVLNPQVEVNIARPDCWTKDGDSDALERWIEDLEELLCDPENGDKEA